MDIQLTDTHCHIHEIIGDLGDGVGHSVPGKWQAANITDPDAVIAEAAREGVDRLICVGCTVEDSELAVQFVQNRENCWASIGIHPHEAQRYVDDPKMLQRFAELLSGPSALVAHKRPLTRGKEPAEPRSHQNLSGSASAESPVRNESSRQPVEFKKIVAVGECGLDFYYNHSPKAAQEKILRFQIELALEHNRAMIFHVRDAFNDFWPIFDEYKGTRGVIHSFTANQQVLDEALARGLYIGLNGIMTFTNDDSQLAAAKNVPLDRLLLETDAPFLTPKPYRGTICVPKHVRLTAEFLTQLRGESLAELSVATTRNAQALFLF